MLIRSPYNASILKLVISFIATILLFSYHDSFSQDNVKKNPDSLIVGKEWTTVLTVGHEYSFVLKSGDKINGVLTSFDSSKIYLIVDRKTVFIKREDIQWSFEMKDAVQYIPPVKLEPDPNTSRLFLAPTGRTQKQGTGYISTAVLLPLPVTIPPLFFPYGSFGLTDYLSLGVGASLFPPLFYISPKVRPLHFKYFDLSAGFVYSNIISTELTSNNNLGMAFISSTVGTEDAALTAGYGTPFYINWKYPDSPTHLFEDHFIMLGGELRIGKNGKLISENWFNFNKYDFGLSVTSMGVRQFWSNFAFEVAFLGVYTNFSLEDSRTFHFVFVPFGSVTWNF